MLLSDILQICNILHKENNKMKCKQKQNKQTKDKQKELTITNNQRYKGKNILWAWSVLFSSMHILGVQVKSQGTLCCVRNRRLPSHRWFGGDITSWLQMGGRKWFASRKKQRRCWSFVTLCGCTNRSNRGGKKSQKNYHHIWKVATDKRTETSCLVCVLLSYCV